LETTQHRWKNNDDDDDDDDDVDEEVRSGQSTTVTYF
jgi:hypothetical protein